MSLRVWIAIALLLTAEAAIRIGCLFDLVHIKQDHRGSPMNWYEAEEGEWCDICHHSVDSRGVACLRVVPETGTGQR